MLSDELVSEVSVDAHIEEDVVPDEEQFLKNGSFLPENAS